LRSSFLSAESDENHLEFLFQTRRLSNTLTETSSWSQPVKERRKLERYQMRVPTRIELSDDAGHLETLRLETTDISASGAFFASPGPISEGAHLKLEMVLPVERLQELIGANKTVEITLEGRVIRRDAGGIAVLFDKKYQIKALNHNHAD
jgi:hypothetical protein